MNIIETYFSNILKCQDYGELNLFDIIEKIEKNKKELIHSDRIEESKKINIENDKTKTRVVVNKVSNGNTFFTFSLFKNYLEIQTNSEQTTIGCMSQGTNSNSIYKISRTVSKYHSLDKDKQLKYKTTFSLIENNTRLLFIQSEIDKENNEHITSYKACENFQNIAQSIINRKKINMEELEMLVIKVDYTFSAIAYIKEHLDYFEKHREIINYKNTNNTKDNKLS